MNETVLRVGCKINLLLRITGVRPDGMHELDSLFYPLQEPHDVLRLACRPEPGLTVLCGNGINPDHNTLTKAYGLFAKETGFAPGLLARLEKGTPSGAGLGGGSADAAALLKWLNENCPAALPQETLAKIAAQVGADVPFFLKNVPCRAQGIGERLTPMPEFSAALKGFGLLLVCPSARVSTPWAYAAWDLLQKTSANSSASRNDLTTPDTTCTNFSFAAFGREIAQGRIRLYNAFEDVVFPSYPEICALKTTLIELGALAAVMSGSGAAVCGFFPKDADGNALVHKIGLGGATAWWQCL